MATLCGGPLRLGPVLGWSCLALSALVQLTEAAKVSPAPPSLLTGAPPLPPALRKLSPPNAARPGLPSPDGRPQLHGPGSPTPPVVLFIAQGTLALSPSPPDVRPGPGSSSSAA